MLDEGLFDAEVGIDDQERGDVLADGSEDGVGNVGAGLVVNVVEPVPGDDGGRDEVGVDMALGGDDRLGGDERLTRRGTRGGPSGKGWPDRPAQMADKKTPKITNYTNMNTNAKHVVDVYASAQERRCPLHRERVCDRGATSAGNPMRLGDGGHAGRPSSPTRMG